MSYTWLCTTQEAAIESATQCMSLHKKLAPMVAKMVDFFGGVSRTTEDVVDAIVRCAWSS